MSSFNSISPSVQERIAHLKEQQSNCTAFLLECIEAREKYPQYAARLDRVIGNIEAVMSRNADMLARLEAEYR